MNDHEIPTAEQNDTPKQSMGTPEKSPMTVDEANEALIAAHEEMSLKEHKYAQQQALLMVAASVANGMLAGRYYTSKESLVSEADKIASISVRIAKHLINEVSQA